MPKDRTPPPPLPEPTLRRRFRRRLLGWYDRHGRDLPWRRTRNPYHILVSEIMLQQTQVDRVLPKYEEWLTRFPTFEALAAARPAQATRAWYPLGYNIRPRRLHAIAREVVATYGGQLPSDETTLHSFRGLGPYTVGAVRSFAFGQRAPIVDTNVARVLHRVFVGDRSPRNHAQRRWMWELSAALLPRRRVFDYNQALMDLGATVCVARRPRCGACPMRAICQEFRLNGDGERGQGRTEATSRRPDGARSRPRAARDSPVRTPRARRNRAR